MMEDYDYIDSTMDGKPFKAGRHAATLRRLLWREHLGLLPAQNIDASKDPNAQPPDVPNDPVEGPEYEAVADPLGDKVWDLWTGNATKNTEMYRHLFRADPDNNSIQPCSYNPLFIQAPVRTGLLIYLQVAYLLPHSCTQRSIISSSNAVVVHLHSLFIWNDVIPAVCDTTWTLHSLRSNFRPFAGFCQDAC